MNLEQWLTWGACLAIPAALIGFALWGHDAEKRGALKPPKYKPAPSGNIEHYCGAGCSTNPEGGFNLAPEYQRPTWTDADYTPSEPAEYLTERGRAVDVTSRDTNVLEGDTNE